MLRKTKPILTTFGIEYKVQPAERLVLRFRGNAHSLILEEHSAAGNDH
jgi:hypothetical protein